MKHEQKDKMHNTTTNNNHRNSNNIDKRIIKSHTVMLRGHNKHSNEHDGDPEEILMGESC